MQMLRSFSFDEEAGVGFNTHVELKDGVQAAECKGKGRYASSQMDGEERDPRHPSENRPEHRKVLEAKCIELVRQCGESHSEAGIQYKAETPSTP